LIPSKLTLKNFMCYRDNVPSLNLDGMHVACLCGDNGSGKSAIFDAITWVLWGESRAKSNDELIYTGQNEMEVELEFILDERRFRVIRKQARSSSSKPGQGILELQSYNNGVFKSISEQNRTETQRKIISLLHLDYQTFINSAMLLQGRANEFSTKRPGERKEILANILDLSFYDELEKLAKANADRMKLEKETLERDIANLGSRINEKSIYDQALDKVLDELDSIEKNKGKLDTELSELRLRKESLNIKKEQISLTQQQVTNRKQELHSRQQLMATQISNIEKFNKVITQKESIEKGYSELRAVINEEEQFNEKLKVYLDLVERKTKLEQLITSATNLYNSERKVIQARLIDLETKHKNLPRLQNTLSELHKQQQALEKTEAEIEVKRKQLVELTSTLSSSSTSNSQLSSSIEEIKRKLEIMTHAGATCPLCESELGPEGHARIEKNLNLELQQKSAQFNENASKIATAKVEFTSLDKELKQKETLFKTERDKLKQIIAVTEKELAESQSAGEELTLHKRRLHKIEDDLRNRNFEVREQHDLARLEYEQKALGYNVARHEEIRQKKLALQEFEKLKQELAQAELRLEAEIRARDETEKDISRLNNLIKELNDSCGQLEVSISTLPQVIEKLQNLERQQESILLQERKVRDRIAELKEKIKQLDLLSIEKQEKENLLQFCREDSKTFSELAEAFSKKGIQAILIEEALPEIGNEANLLLGKMTDNRMSLTLETQRGTKKGDIIETLDIKIADELGTRNYEMYSGGEAFRIDLALRIAISRLLVRRAGASLPILIIDEGFGTQDSSSLEKLIEAINSIQDDFEKIFIITHLEELKDKFPVLINVSKTPEGSMVSISQ